jgi:hypothetical protein
MGIPNHGPNLLPPATIAIEHELIEPNVHTSSIDKPDTDQPNLAAPTLEEPPPAVAEETGSKAPCGSADTAVSKSLKKKKAGTRGKGSAPVWKQPSRVK